MIQEYASHQRSNLSKMMKERWYRLSWEGKGFWDKLLEPANATISGNTKTTHRPFTHIKFHDITLGDPIKYSYYQFDFGETPNEPSNNNLFDGDHTNNNDGDTSMILTFPIETRFLLLL